MLNKASIVKYRCNLNFNFDFNIKGEIEIVWCVVMWEIRWLINVNNLPYRILVYKTKNLKVSGKINHGETPILGP